jgi:hypothetical protein
VCFSNPPSYTFRQSHARLVGGEKPDEEAALRSSRIVGDWAQGQQPYLVKPKLFRTPHPKIKYGEAMTRIRAEAPPEGGGGRFSLKII